MIRGVIFDGAIFLTYFILGDISLYAGLSKGDVEGIG